MTAPQEKARLAYDLIAKERSAEAKEIFLSIKKTDCQDAEDLNHVGLIAYKLEDNVMALPWFEEAVTKNKHPAYLNNLALTLFRLKHDADAIAKLTEALTLDQKNIATLYNLAMIHETRGELDLAFGFIKKALALNPTHTDVSAMASSILRQQKKIDDAFKIVDLALKKNPAASLLHYEMGHILMVQKDYEDSFASFENMHKHQSTHNTKRQDVEAEDRELLAFYNELAQNTQTTTRAPDLNEPVYVVGAPRSGTSLLGQMLGMHEKLFHADELTYVKDLYSQANALLNSPNNAAVILKRLWSEKNPQIIDSLKSHGKKLLEPLYQESAGRQIIDKLPSNVRRLGLIALIHPHAAIIHIIRDGREVAFSNYTQYFKYFQWQAQSLESALYDWQTSLYIGRAGAKATGQPYLEIRYEDLVLKPKETLTTVLNFLGLNWVDACLNYHQSQQRVRTASYQQVRQKLFTSSLHKAKNFTKPYQMMTVQAQNLLKELGYL